MTLIKSNMRCIETGLRKQEPQTKQQRADYRKTDLTHYRRMPDYV